jgi:hypothetical protein
LGKTLGLEGPDPKPLSGSATIIITELEYGFFEAGIHTVIRPLIEVSVPVCPLSPNQLNWMKKPVKL